MARFNSVVTLGFLITKHITKLHLVYYFTAEILCALLGRHKISLFNFYIMIIIGNEANLGANSPSYAFPLPTIFGIEILASALLMAE